MRLRISHTTSYRYDRPVPHALQQLRLRPKAGATQNVLDWDLVLDGAVRETGFEDQNRNQVDLVSLTPGASEVTITATGEVETLDTAGVIGPHGGFAPLWLFERPTALTKPGTGARRLAQSVAAEKDPLSRLHLLMGAVAGAIVYTPGGSAADWTAEEAIAAGTGVCQDMAHAFIAAARLGGLPARYVSGYLMLADRVDQEAGHAWAEAHVPGLGWVGFDPANNKSPDAAYVRLATGLDYAEAAPVSGLRVGPAVESLSVSLSVAPVAAQSQSQQ